MYQGYTNSATWGTHMYLTQDAVHVKAINILSRGDVTPEIIEAYAVKHVRLDDWMEGGVNYEEIAEDWRNDENINTFGLSCEDFEDRFAALMASISDTFGGSAPDESGEPEVELIFHEDVATIIANCEVEGNAVYLPGKLERSLYVKTDRVLTALGGKWNRGAKAHLFKEDPVERINQYLITGRIERQNTNSLEFFPTTGETARGVVARADIQPGMLVLEPEIGEGHLADAVVAAVPNVEIRGYEKDAERCRKVSQRYAVEQADFLEVEPVAVFDRVVQNPPFSKQQECRHVLHAYKFLKPGTGKLVSVMSAAILYRDTGLYSELRALIEATGGTIERNPDGAFKAAGTMVHTVTITLPKGAEALSVAA